MSDLPRDGASGSGDNQRIADAMDAIDQYFNAHAPKANEGVNGDMTDEQIAQMGDARAALLEGRHVAYSSPLWAGVGGGAQALASQATLLASGNLTAALKNTQTAGQNLAAETTPGTDVKGFNWDVIGGWVKAHKWEIAAVGGLITLLAVASIAKSAREIIP